MFNDEEKDNMFHRIEDGQYEGGDTGTKSSGDTGTKSSGNACKSINRAFRKVRRFLVRWYLIIFFELYPKELNIPYTPEGEIMRKYLGWAVVAHCTFTVSSCLFVGFQSTSINIGLACWSYSLYLTLNQWQVWLYIVFLGGCIFIGMTYGLISCVLWSQTWGLIFNMIMYGLLIIAVLKAYFSYAMKGGLYGTTGGKGKNQHSQSAARIFQNACKNLQKDEMFTDKDFPATMESISGNANDQGSMPKIQDVCDGWKRATEFKNATEDTPEIFKDGISPNDVAQGSLGDCYLLAALATIAEWPHRIEKVFLSTQADKRQIFGIWLFKNGMKTHVLVDNQFPVLKDGYQGSGMPIFAKSHGNELWPAIAEKCYAKYHKGYMIIEGGNTGPTMRELTGAPTYMFNFTKGQQIDGLWEKLVEGEKKQFGMSAGTGGKDEGELDDNGIVPGHAYTLIAAKQVKNKNGNKERLVQLRNPWKKGEWNGRYSDKSADWTDSLKEELNWSDEDDGIFWMPYEDMCHAYNCLDICKIDDKNTFSFTKVEESSKGYAFVKFKVMSDSAKGQLTTFAVSQKDCRAEEADGNSKFDLNSYTRRVKCEFVQQVDSQKGILDDGNHKVLTDGECEESKYALRERFTEFKTFKAGTYYMYVKLDWNGKAATKNYAVNCYGPNKVQFMGDESEKFTDEQIETLLS